MTTLMPPHGGTTALQKASFALACACLVAFPALFLRLPTVANASFGWLLAFCALALFAAPSASLEAWRLLWRKWPVVLAMAALPLALLLHQVATRPGLPHIPYLYLRFAFFVLLAWGMLRMGTLVHVIQWGFVAGAIGSAFWMHMTIGSVRPMHIGLFNLIPFANLCLLMGMLALISIGWGRRHRVETVLKVLAGVAGLYASYLSGTRGSWIAIPVLLLVVIMSARHIAAPLRWPVLVASVAAIAVLGFTSDAVANRWQAAIDGVRAFALGHNLDTPEGFRLQLWRASVLLFAEHPWLGVGPENWRPAVAALSRDGVLTPLAATFDHSHNDVLFAAATLGIPGVLAVLATYFVPGIYFLRAMRHPDEDARIAAALGLAVVTGFFLFGLTETMFYVSLSNAFYSLTVAACFALVAGGGARAQKDAR